MRRALVSIAFVGCSSFSATPATPEDDAGVTVVDGGTTADAATRYCDVGQPLLCADWDGPVVGEWQQNANATQATGTTLEIVAASAFEGGLGLHARLPRGGGPIDITQVLQDYETSAGADAFVEAQVRVHQPTSAWSHGALTVLALQYTTSVVSTVEAKIVPSTDDPTKASLYLYARGKDLAGTQSPSIAIPYGSWLRVRLEARIVTDSDAGAIPGTGTMTVIGSGNVTAQVTRGPLDGTARRTRTVVGLMRFANTTDADIDVDYDDVIGGLL